jgi:hypothetical protein
MALSEGDKELIAAINELSKKVENLGSGKGGKKGKQTDLSKPEGEESAEDKARREAAIAANERKILQQAKYNTLLAETASLLGDTNTARENELAALEGILSQNEELRKAMDVKKGQQMDMNALLDEESFSFTIENEELNKQVERFRELKLLQEARAKYSKTNQKMLSKMAGSIGLATDFQDSFLSSTLTVTKALTQSGKEGSAARKQFIEDFNKIFNLQNLIGTVIQNSIKLMKDFDDARAQLAKATGAGYQYSDAMFEAQRETNLLGVSMADAGKATASLVENTSNFAKMNKEVQAGLVATTAKLDKIGVDGQTASDTFQFLNLNLGMTAEQAQDVQKQLAVMGEEIGITSARMTKDFNAALPTLAVYGNRSIDIFTNLAAAAKAAGVETGTLMGIAKKFDTFQGAAEGAAKMNALLGTQLSTTQMLMMSEDERIETLIESVQAQGVAFKDLSKFEQQAIAAAAGIDDMNEAQRIFGMNIGDYRRNQQEMKKSADVQKKFEDAIQATVPVMEQFKLLATEIVMSVQPMLETLGGFAGKLVEYFKGMDTEMKESIGNFIVFGGALGMFAMALAPVAVAGLSAASSIATLGSAAAAGGAGAGAGAAGFKALGLGILSVGAGVASVILPMAGLVLSIGAVVGAVSLVVSAFAEWEEMSVRTAEAEARTAQAYANSAGSLARLADVDFTEVSKNVKKMVEDIASLGKGTDIMLKARSTIENIALISTGTAKDSMTGNVVTASGTNITNNVENIFSGMKLVLEIGGEKIEGVIRDIAEDAATQ